MVLVEVGLAGDGRPARVRVVDRQDLGSALAQVDDAPRSGPAGRRRSGSRLPTALRSGWNDETRGANAPQDAAAFQRRLAQAMGDHRVVEIAGESQSGGDRRSILGGHACASAIPYSGKSGVER